MFTHKPLTTFTERFSKIVATLAVGAMVLSGVPVYAVDLPTYITTLPATGITSTDATLNGLNGDNAATGHSFWVSTSTFSTASPSIPAGVYSTPNFGAIASNTPFSALLSLVTTSGIPSNMATITPSTTYYFAAWSDSGTWQPGEILSFTTLPPVDTTAPTTPVHVSPADNSTVTTAALTEIQWTDSTDGDTPPVTYIYQSSTSSSTNPDGSFTAPAYTSSPLTTSEIAAGGTPEGVYYWHVKATDSATIPNSSPWTDAWKITVDNTPPPGTSAIIVNKVVLGVNGATTTDSTTFTFKLNGAVTTTGSDISPAVFSGLASSTYTLTEDALAGYDLVSITPSSTVSVGDNSTTTVTVVNQQQANASTTATINIHKVTNNPSNHNTNFNFSLNQGTTTVATTTANASTGDGNFTLVAPGTYKIVEGDTELWNFTSVSCTGGVPEDEDTVNHAVNLTVNAGDNVTCTFTNTAESGVAHVVKKILAADGSTLATYDDTLFGIHAIGFDGSIGQFNGGATSTNLFAGSYTLTEDANANYDLVSITSNTNASTTSGVFTISNGTTTEIEVVNQQRASTTGKIIVRKAANPSDINQSFNFTLERGTTLLGTGTTTGTSTVEFGNLPSGTYKLTELQIPNWNYDGATCTYNGGSVGSEISFGKSIDIGADDVVDCTFTNTSTKGTIRVVKNVIDSTGADISDTHAFSVTLNGTSTKTVAEGTDAIYTDLTVSESLYTIAESPDSGYDLVSITSSSTVSVAAGTTTVVTITNRKHAAPSDTSGGGSTNSGGGRTGGSTSPLASTGSVLGATTDTSGGTTGAAGQSGNTGNTGSEGRTYYPSGSSSEGTGSYNGGGSTYLSTGDSTTTDATTTDLVQMPSGEELNQLAAAAAASSGAVTGSWLWWLLFIIILAVLYYLYRRSRVV